MEAKRVYPDFNRESKWLGIIDYKAVIILLGYVVVSWHITGIFLEQIFTRIYIVAITAIPIFSIFYINISETNTTHMVYTILKYIFSRKIYVYKINQKARKSIFSNCPFFKKIQTSCKRIRKMI